MGKSNKPIKWFRAVKKVFRSPSKDKGRVRNDTKVNKDENILPSYNRSPASQQVPTPHPLPSFEIITHDDIEPDYRQGQPLPTPEAVDPTFSVHSLDDEEDEMEEVIEPGHNDRQALFTPKAVDTAPAIHSLNVEEKEVEEVDRGHTHGQPFSTPETVHEPVSAHSLNEEEDEVGAVTGPNHSHGQSWSPSKAVDTGFSVHSPNKEEDEEAAAEAEHIHRQPLSVSGATNTAISVGFLYDEEDKVEAVVKTDQTHKQPTPEAVDRAVQYLDEEIDEANEEIEPDHSHGQPLVIVDTLSSADSLSEEDAEADEVIASKRVSQSEESLSDDNNGSSGSDEEEAAMRIRKPFEDPSALRSLIRLQAVVRGHQVRRQAAATLCIVEALVRIQAQVRGRHVRMSKEGHTVQIRILGRRHINSRSSKLENGRPDVWRGILRDKFTQPSNGEEGACKRKGLMAYAFSRKVRFVVEDTQHPTVQQDVSGNQERLRRSTSDQSSMYINCNPDQYHSGWTWLERWTVARPWEDNHTEESSEIIFSQRISRDCAETDVNTLKKYYGDLPTSSFSPPSISRSLPSEQREPESTDSHHQHKMHDLDSLLVPLPSHQAGNTITHSPLNCWKPPPIDVSSHRAILKDVRDAHQQPITPQAQTSPGSESSISVPPSPALSDSSLPVPPSPQASDTSLPVPETPPSVGSAEDDLSATMEHLVLPEPQDAGAGESHIVASRSPNLLSGNGVHGRGGVSPKLPESISDNARNGVKVGGNGNNLFPTSRRPASQSTSRYMASTESAKAKFRSTSNPKTRSPDTVAPPAQQLKRFSLGGAQVGRTESPKTTMGTNRTGSIQTRGSPSPKTGLSRDKSLMETGTHSPARRRNSYGGAESKFGSRYIAPKPEWQRF